MPGGVSRGEGYDKGSTNQGSANQGALEWLRKGGAAAVEVAPGVINILDLGSATGKNSAMELKVAVEALRKAEGSAKQDIIITHVDTTYNDWNQLSKTLTTSPDSYLTATDRLYSHFQAKSFFEQVAPARTIALAYSGISFHWISKNRPLSDFWCQEPHTADRKAYEANKHQAAQDWLQLLQMRAIELLPGGYLVATAATLKGCESFNYLAGFINKGWNTAASQGLITQEECQTFMASHWFRSREEWLAPLQGELKDTFEVLQFQEDAVTDANWHKYQQRDGDESQRRQMLAEGYAEFFFGVSSGLVAGHLEKRSTEEIDKVIDLMRKEFVKQAAADPIEFKLAYALIVLKRK
ncbi:hypothetical protein WJX74_004819 [Apatococcus lobatus]|uniref:SAM dependent carboxyl methyltransferase n=1 Tax=Apatococcus lobatus TaxID=904363 RepID=A0AAW1QH72_9CHLO